MYKRGTVVLIPFPFSDLSGNKVRPAVIISKITKSSDVIVLFITSQDKINLPHTITLSPTNENGLKVKSKVICSKIATLEAKTALGELGILDSVTLSRIENELKSVLGF